MNEKLFSEAMSEVDDKYYEEAEKYKSKRYRWVKWSAVAACLCLVICVLAVPRLSEKSNNSVSGDLSSMVYVNDTLYRIAASQPDLTGKESQLVYIGTISSTVSSSEYPKENLEANDDIAGSEVYQFGEDIVVEIDGEYWTYCAVLDVDYTVNDDETYTCWGYTFQYMIEVSGIDGESEITYIILTNDKETDFEDVSYSLIDAEMHTGEPEFVIIGWYY